LTVSLTLSRITGQRHRTKVKNAALTRRVLDLKKVKPIVGSWLWASWPVLSLSDTGVDHDPSSLGTLVPVTLGSGTLFSV
jgi:hypothetical protein